MNPKVQGGQEAGLLGGGLPPSPPALSSPPLRLAHLPATLADADAESGVGTTRGQVNHPQQDEDVGGREWASRPQ